MEIVFAIIGAGVVIFFVAAFISDRNREERIAIYMEHLEGVSNVPYKEGISVRVRAEEKQIEMEYKKEKIYLPFRQLVSVNIIIWEKTITKALNPMAEGIVGGILGGGTMAVVSAIDAKGRTRQEKIKIDGALEIQYHPKDGFGTVQRLVFWDKSDSHDRYATIQFAKTLCHYANLPEPRYIQPQPKGPTYL